MCYSSGKDEKYLNPPLSFVASIIIDYLCGLNTKPYIMNKNIMLLAMGIAALAVGCNGNKTNNTNTADTTAVNTLLGTYEGTLPAADCPGINTSLTINADSTYDLTSHYIDQKDTIRENGVYHLHNGKLIELVTPSSGDKNYYKVMNDSTLIMTDDKGEEPTGELRQNYQLHKKAQ